MTDPPASVARSRATHLAGSCTPTRGSRTGQVTSCYDLATLGELAVAALAGLQSGAG
ncbi:MAG: hypothetical protein ACLP7J_24480 [Streptosporangiaceae bacterium]